MKLVKLRLAAVVLALPLLAFDCGGGQQDQGPPGACKLQIRGTAAGANEDLWRIVTAYDYASLDPANTMWGFELVAYRGMTAVGAGVGFFHDGRPSVASAYGWSGASSSVSSGGATRYAADGTTLTHEATAPLSGVGGTGALSVTFTRIPPPGATGAQLMDVHGSLSGTLPALDAVSPQVTFSATF